MDTTVVTPSVSFFAGSAVAAFLCYVIVLTVIARGQATTLGRAFQTLCVLFGVTGVALTFWIHRVSMPVFRFVEFRGYLVIGMAIAWVFLAIQSKPRYLVFVGSSPLLNGLCISVAFSYYAIEIGKLQHDGEMREFFLQSGLSVGLMYFTMVVETIGATALMFRRIRLLAAVLLMLLMCGAIGTHVRNHDPLSDSLDAIHLLVTLACIGVLQFWVRETKSAAAAALT